MLPMNTDVGTMHAMTGHLSFAYYWAILLLAPDSNKFETMRVCGWSTFWLFCPHCVAQRTAGPFCSPCTEKGTGVVQCMTHRRHTLHNLSSTVSRNHNSLHKFCWCQMNSGVCGPGVSEGIAHAVQSAVLTGVHVQFGSITWSQYSAIIFTL